ncbi:MAG: type II secretion system F family protein, partial [Parcubacteria group bacterium]
MAIYDYRAKDQEGLPAAGAVVAPSENVAYNILRDKNLYVISLRLRARSQITESLLNYFNRVKEKEVVFFSRQLSVMISAGVPLVKALKTIVKQTQNMNFKVIISDIADEVEGGAKLSASLGKYPSVYTNFFTQMVRSAETTGKLDEILLYLADQTEKDYDLKGKVKGALIYPAFILTALVLVGAGMMIFVVPQLIAVLTAGGGELPVSTKMLIFVSNFLQNYWWTIILFIAIIGVMMRFVTRSEQGQLFIDRFKIHMPLFGKIFQSTYIVRFSRSLSTLLVSGVPLGQG